MKMYKLHDREFEISIIKTLNEVRIKVRELSKNLKKNREKC